MAWLRTFLRDRRGAAAAEMALVAPFLVILMFVTFEGGYFLWNEHKVVKGVRDGARYAGRLPFSNYTTCAASPSAPTAVPDAAADLIKEVTRTGKISGGTPSLTGWVKGNVTVTCDYVDRAGVTGGAGMYETNGNRAPRVTVSAAVTYPDSPLTALAGVLGFDVGQIQLRATAQSPVMGL